MFIICWFWISIWYVSWMSCAKADAANKINEFVAVYEKKSEIDTNASAGPLMIVNNFWNIIWPVLWGFCIDVAWFQWFFVLFWIMIAIFMIYSWFIYKKINSPAYIFESADNS